LLADANDARLHSGAECECFCTWLGRDAAAQPSENRESIIRPFPMQGLLLICRSGCELLALSLSPVLISLANGSIFKMKPLLKSLSLRLLLAQSAVQSFHLSFQSTPFGVPSASEMSARTHTRATRVFLQYNRRRGNNFGRQQFSWLVIIPRASGCG
jgi:hypothetical protein